MKAPLLRIFFAIACVGWIITLSVHIAAFRGFAMQTNELLALGAGIGVVWLAAIIRLKMENQDSNAIPITRIFTHAPMWVRVIAIAGFAYAFIGFFVFKSQEGTRFTTVTAEATRSFSRFALAFYGLAMAALFPEKQKTE